MKPIIFVCGHRKGGTSMFHNLFDGHNDVSVYPVDLNILYGYFPQFTQNSYSVEQLKERLNRVIFEDLQTIPALQGKVNFRAFKSLFYEKVSQHNLNDIDLVMTSLLESYSETHTKNNYFKYHLFKETSIELYAQELAEKFPNGKFLHLIRDPRDNFASISSGLDTKYRGYGDSKNSLMFSMINRALYGFKMAAINKQLLGENRYKVVRFEDLASNPKSVMTDVCQWLEIPYQDCLTIPSIFGEVNQGNNFEDIKFNNVSSENVGRWRERISTADAALIELMFKEEMLTFDYQLQSSDAEKANSIGEFYKWMNYKYLYHDRFTSE